MASTETSNKPIPFNQNVAGNIVTEFDESWAQLLKYAEANNLEKPRKGKFTGDILQAGLNSWKPEDYYKKTRG